MATSQVCVRVCAARHDDDVSSTSAQFTSYSTPATHAAVRQCIAILLLEIHADCSPTIIMNIVLLCVVRNEYLIRV